jgi:hypothetical protein
MTTDQGIVSSRNHSALALHKTPSSNKGNPHRRNESVLTNLPSMRLQLPAIPTAM